MTTLSAGSQGLSHADTVTARSAKTASVPSANRASSRNLSGTDRAVKPVSTTVVPEPRHSKTSVRALLSGPSASTRTRAPRGEGKPSLRSDGRWAVQTMSGYTANGKRSVKTIYGKTERECIIKLGAFLEGRPIGSTSKVSSGTVGEFLDAWLASKEGTIRPSTLSRYAELCRNHLKPALGNLRTARLTPVDIRNFLAGLTPVRDTPSGATTGPSVLASSTRRQIYTILKQAYAQGVRDEILDRNPLVLVKAPRLEQRAPTMFQPDEVGLLLTAAEAGVRSARIGSATTTAHQLWVFLLAAALTGAREGEILALRWSDIVNDPDRPYMLISRTISRATGKPLGFNPPKTLAGLRHIPLEPLLRDALADLRNPGQTIAVPEGVGNDGLVFTTATGKPLGVHNVIKSFKELLRVAGLARTLRIHDLRHTAGSTMLASGVPLTTVSKILGHANAAITARIYAHALAKGDSAAVATLAGAFGLREKVTFDEVHSRQASRHPAQDGPTSVTNLIFNVTGMRAPTDKVAGGSAGARTQNQRIKSPLLYH